MKLHRKQSLNPRLKKTGFYSEEHQNNTGQFMTDELSHLYRVKIKD